MNLGSRMRWGVIALVLAAAAVAACDAVTSVAADGADFGGAKADAYCDRRYVDAAAPTAKPAAFCQEVLSTVAASQFSDDCRSNHLATAGPGKCPRSKIIAGCKLRETHKDDSTVFDWYYDVGDVVGDGDAPDAGDGGPFEARARTVADVAAMCADPLRYETGADLVMP